MSAQDLEQRARELLAAELEAEGDQSIAIKLRRGDAGMDYSFVAALRAIVAALRQQPAPVVGDAAACRLDDYLSGEFSLRIGKQAARAALTAALARAQGVQS